jgi:hypothetical protein
MAIQRINNVANDLELLGQELELQGFGTYAQRVFTLTPVQPNAEVSSNLTIYE